MKIVSDWSRTGLFSGFNVSEKKLLTPFLSHVPMITYFLCSANNLIASRTSISVDREEVTDTIRLPKPIRDHFIGVVLILIILLVHGTTSEAQEIGEALFISLPPEEQSWAEKKINENLAKDRTLNQIDYVRLRSGRMLEKTLLAGLKGLPVRPIVLMLPKIPAVTVVTESVILQSQGFIAWSGHIEGAQDSLVSIIVGESDPKLEKDIVLYGTIVVRGKTFQIHPAEMDTYAIAEINTSKFPREGPPRIWKPEPILQPLERPSRTIESIEKRRAIKKPFTMPSAEKERFGLMFHNSCRIDVLVAYTDLAKAEAEPNGCNNCSIDAEIQASILLANNTYKVSRVNQRLNIVNTPGVNYEACITENNTRTCYLETVSPPPDLVTDHNNLLTANPDGPTPPTPGHDNYPLTIIHRWRNTLNADLVALWVKGPQDVNGNSIGNCGQSTLMWEDPDHPGIFPDDFSEQALAVVSRKCAMSNYSMAHEFGHLGAAHHDRPYEAGTPPGTPDSLYSYDFAYPTGNWRTIMAQNLNGQQCPSGAQCCTTCTRIPFWSNPDVSYMGSPTGITDQSPPPMPELSANNHTTLNQSASTVSGFRLPRPSPGVCEGSVIGDPPPATPGGLRIN